MVLGLTAHLRLRSTWDNRSGHTCMVYCSGSLLARQSLNWGYLLEHVHEHSELLGTGYFVSDVTNPRHAVQVRIVGCGDICSSGSWLGTHALGPPLGLSGWLLRAISWNVPLLVSWLQSTAEPSFQTLLWGYKYT